MATRKLTTQPKLTGNAAAEALGQAMADEINFDILTTVLCEQGWARARVSPKTNEADVVAWVKTNCKHRTEHLSNRWLFESPKDAAWFVLRWT